MVQNRGSPRRPETVTQVKDRDLYQARLTLPDGRRPAKYFKTKREGRDWGTKMLTDAKRGVAVVESSDSVAKLLDDWLKAAVLRNIRPNTVYKYELSVK